MDSILYYELYEWNRSVLVDKRCLMGIGAYWRPTGKKKKDLRLEQRQYKILKNI